MRNRYLSREEALAEYLIYKIRVFEYLHIFQILDDIMTNRYCPQNHPLGHGSSEFLDTLRTASTGFFASLMDPNNLALDVLDVWVVLFPEKKDRITDTWRKIEPHLPLIKDYRNDVAFHINKDIRRYFRTRRTFRENREKIVPAMQEFWNLAAELMKEEPRVLPNLRSEVDPILSKAFPSRSPEELEKLKDYLIEKRNGEQV